MSLKSIASLSREEGNLWLLPFISIIVFTVVSLLGFEGDLQKWFLFGGALICFLVSIGTLALYLKKDYVLQALVFGSLVFWAVAYPAAINGNDDNTAYLVFAEQFSHGISDTLHSLSERRLFSVGASYSFQAPIMMFLGPKWLSLFEPVLGLSLLFLLALSSRKQNRHCSTVELLSCAIIGVLPLAGTSYLANTSSVFVLASCSFAILLLCRKAYSGEPLGEFHYFIAGILCVYASLLRPTTLPFNIIILSSAAAYSCWKLKNIQPYLLPSLGILAGFFLSTYKYSQVFGTKLFPILGRGFHITSFGYSTSSDMTILSLLYNVIKTTFSDPILLASIALFWLLLILRGKSEDLGLIVPLSGLLLFSSLIILSTGGLAAKRYIYPVALSCLLYGIAFLPQATLFSSPEFVRPSRLLRFTVFLTAASMLLLPRLLVGEKIIQKRLLMYSPSGQDHDSIRKLKAKLEPALERGSSALLLSTGIERFIIKETKGRFVIMDQPGMMMPWMNSNPTTSYEEGLRGYMSDQKIDFVVARKPFSSGVLSSRDSGSNIGSWSRLMVDAADANSRALFNILRDWDRSEVGALTIYSRRSKPVPS